MGKLLILFMITLSLAGCATVTPYKLDCEWEPVEVPPGEIKIMISPECERKILEMQIRCGGEQ